MQLDGAMMLLDDDISNAEHFCTRQNRTQQLLTCIVALTALMLAFDARSSSRSDVSI
jgi:hypothetical protein